MELHTLKKAPGSRKNRKRIGRGPASGTGKTSGKGHKGGQARSGYHRKFGFEGGQNPLHRRLPKRGFNHEKRWPMAVVNLDTLEELFEEGAEVTSANLVARGIAQDFSGGVKLLARGELKKKLTVKVQAVSAGARAKIEAAGGTIEISSANAQPSVAEAQAS
ncbi:MAG: 50S ribosomal protein L15 [Candidatus Hydrogenedentes bacterium]|nr:50S ribosomal protein L15 [Candidatus Hydrogenedentota bacterium]MBI3118029.1 50S ribosomal protein L15 [Candidatus Hydrogenedentota bacterium]